MHDDLSSELDYSSEVERKRKRRDECFAKPEQPQTSKATKDFFYEECAKSVLFILKTVAGQLPEHRLREATKRQNVLQLDVYSRHKRLINQYFLTNPSATSILKRDESRDKTDIDVIRANSKFLWDEYDEADSWEQKLAKKYYDKLYKEYCIGDLTGYKENKIGLRWRIEKEVIEGKGQFICGEKHCSATEDLVSWECKFNYMEHGEQRTALVKLRLCPSCSEKLNYRHKKNVAKNAKRSPGDSQESSSGSSDDDILNAMLP